MFPILADMMAGWQAPSSSIKHSRLKPGWLSLPRQSCNFDTPADSFKHPCIAVLWLHASCLPSTPDRRCSALHCMQLPHPRLLSADSKLPGSSMTQCRNRRRGPHAMNEEPAAEHSSAGAHSPACCLHSPCGTGPACACWRKTTVAGSGRHSARSSWRAHLKEQICCHQCIRSTADQRWAPASAVYIACRIVWLCSQ